jgi:uncharacterized protein YrrD
MKQFRRVRDLLKLNFHGDDGRLGTVQELYFDDHTGAVRYLVVRTGGWLLGRDVLIAPMAIDRIDDTDGFLQTHLRKEQIEQAPPIEKAKPISRRYEETYFRHFGWAPYWQPGPAVWGGAVPFPERPTMSLDQPPVSKPPEQSHLRSSAEVTGYRVHATDGDIGHIEDLVFDDHEWMVRYVEVDTRNWLPGKQVLVPTGRITKIDWHTRSVSMSLTRHAIQSAPPYDPSQLITPDYEVQLFTHYGKEAV